MKRLIPFFFALILLSSFTIQTPDPWADPKYKAANTAKDIDYLTAEEKNVFYFVNLARIDPKKFAEVYIKRLLPGNNYEKSLYQTLNSMKPVPLWTPDPKMFELAKCWAIEAGKSGVIGHDRKKCKESNYLAECCSYGEATGLEIVLQLLIDSDVPSLGHRKALLSPAYKIMGVSIQPHKKWTYNAVLDMR
jgi:hypothetical protein